MKAQSPIIVEPRTASILNLVPLYFRDKFPFKYFYWQNDQIAATHKRADDLAKDLDW